MNETTVSESKIIAWLNACKPSFVTVNEIACRTCQVREQARNIIKDK